jgi:hypothetical protein
LYIEVGKMKSASSETPGGMERRGRLSDQRQAAKLDAIDFTAVNRREKGNAEGKKMVWEPDARQNDASRDSATSSDAAPSDLPHIVLTTGSPYENDVRQTA